MARKRSKKSPLKPGTFRAGFPPVRSIPPKDEDENEKATRDAEHHFGIRLPGAPFVGAIPPPRPVSNFRRSSDARDYLAQVDEVIMGGRGGVRLRVKVLRESLFDPPLSVSITIPASAARAIAAYMKDETD